IARLARRWLPGKAAYALIRWKNVLLQMATFRLSRTRPTFVKRLIRKGNEKSLPVGYDVDTHFKPRYHPWDQRLCLVPHRPLFESMSSGRAEIVTDRIETFTEAGIKLESGVELEADVIITATGLKVLFLGGMQVAVDGEEVDFSKRMAYKGMMLNGI